MPHVGSLYLVSSAAYTPIVGNTSTGGACYDGNGQALWITNVNGQMQVWRTRAGWQTLISQDGSVDYLSTVDVGPFTTGTILSSGALWRVGSNLYAIVNGLNTGTSLAGQWLYRDNSGKADGSGPWVKVGTIQSASLPASWSVVYGIAITGEILVSGSRWVTPCASWSMYGGQTPNAQPGVATSDDGGATWTVRLSYGWYNTISARGFSRNFAQYAGAWYVGGRGNAEAGKHWKSTDLAGWADIGALGYGAQEGAQFPVSTPQGIFHNPTDVNGNALWVEFANAAPETMPTWQPMLQFPFPAGGDPGARNFPHLANISNDSQPTYVAVLDGQVTGFSSSVAQAPPCRRYPRDDGLAESSSPRHWPLSVSQQGGFRKSGGTYY